jgi:ribonuclease HI
MPSRVEAELRSTIIVFADGACTGNPGPGGWGVIIATPDGHVTELGGRAQETTNNQMELTAVGKALRHLESASGTISVFTDSSYVINGITKWIWGWRKKGWKTSEGKDVANVEFWKRLSALVARREEAIEWKYVRGHSGVPGNERVDEIAVAFSKGDRPALYSGPLLKYDIAIYDLPDDTEVPQPSAKKKAAEPAYSYLSLVGNTPARHASWAECERRVKGVSGAKFKKCASADEEKAVLASWGFPGGIK